MKRLRGGPSNSSDLEQKKAHIRRSILSLPSVDQNSLHAEIHPSNKSKEVEFLLRMYDWQNLDNARIFKVQTSKSKAQENPCNLELKDRVESLKKQVEEQSSLQKLQVEKLNSLKKQVEELNQNIIKHPRGVLDDNERTVSRFPETMLIWSEFEKNVAKLMGWLKSSEACVIGVWGMGGVGKTALVKHVYYMLLQDNTFHGDVHWLTASDSLCDDVYNWQVIIAKRFGLDLSGEEDEMKRTCKLYEALGRRNSVLILDNVWQPFQAAEIGIPLGESGCKIILTTRSLEVCRLMGCKDFVVEVHTLPTEESLALFEEKIENCDMLTEEVIDVVRQIVRRCKGLPLAIVSMAYRMRGVVDIDEWNYTLHELDICEQGDMNEKVFPRLQCSLDQLNDETLQKCFLSSLFYIEISTFDGIRKDWLVDRWNKEGLLDNKTERYPMMPMRLAKGLAIIKKLVSLCLLSELDDDDDADDDYIKLHGLIRDMGIRFNHKVNQCFMTERSNSIQCGEVPDNELWSEDLVRVSLHSYGIHQIPCELSPKCPKLIVLDLSNNRFAEIPGSFFVNMEALTVLDLSKTGIVSLPDSVCNLKSLRTLLLSGCEELTHVPSLTMLTKLRVLDLFGVLKIDALMVVENLKSLEMLKFSWKMSDLSCFNRLMTSKAFTSSLEEYTLEVYDGPDECETLESPCNNRVVVIDGVKFDDEKVISLPCNIEELLVKDCHIKNLADGFPSLNETMLNRLVLRQCRGMEYIFSANQQVPPIFLWPKSPQKLIIECLPDLRGIIKLQGNVTRQSAYALANLRDLSIYGCQKMGNVFAIKLVQQSFRFIYLQKVEVNSCEGLEEIFESINNDVGAASNYNLVLPNLRVLRLTELPKLESIYRGLLLCPSIKTIAIIDCPNYKGVELSKPLICDKSPRTLAALPPYNPKGDFWRPLIRDYPNDAPILRGVVDEYQRSKQNWEPSSGPAPQVANQAFAPPAEMPMNQSASQGQPQTELSLFACVHAPVYNAGPEVESCFLNGPFHYNTLNDPGPSSSSRQDPNMPWDGQHITDYFKL